MPRREQRQRKKKHKYINEGAHSSDQCAVRILSFLLFLMGGGGEVVLTVTLSMVCGRGQDAIVVVVFQREHNLAASTADLRRTLHTRFQEDGVVHRRLCAVPVAVRRTTER